MTISASEKKEMVQEFNKRLMELDVFGENETKEALPDTKGPCQLTSDATGAFGNQLFNYVALWIVSKLYPDIRVCMPMVRLVLHAAVIFWSKSGFDDVGLQGYQKDL